MGSTHLCGKDSTEPTFLGKNEVGVKSRGRFPEGNITPTDCTKGCCPSVTCFLVPIRTHRLVPFGNLCGEP